MHGVPSECGESVRQPKARGPNRQSRKTPASGLRECPASKGVLEPGVAKLAHEEARLGRSDWRGIEDGLRVPHECARGSEEPPAETLRVPLLVMKPQRTLPPSCESQRPPVSRGVREPGDAELVCEEGSLGKSSKRGVEGRLSHKRPPARGGGAAWPAPRPAQESHERDAEGISLAQQESWA